MSKRISKLLKAASKKRRAVSPIVAEMLLIGLTMLAGALAFGTVIAVMTSKEPIVVTIDSFSDFRLNGVSNSTKYNSFSFILDNQGKRAVGVRAQDFQLLNETNGSIIPNWIISRDYTLGSLQSYYITVNCTTNNQNFWLTFNSTIEVKLIAYGLEDSYDAIDKATISSTITIDKNLVSTGPLQIISDHDVPGTGNYATLNSSIPGSNSMNITIQNYGNLNVTYSLDFIVSNRSITMTLQQSDGSFIPSTELYGYLTAAIGNQPKNSTNIILTATTLPSSTNNYFIIVWLKINGEIQDTLIITCS